MLHLIFSKLGMKQTLHLAMLLSSLKQNVNLYLIISNTEKRKRFFAFTSSDSQGNFHVTASKITHFKPNF